MGRGIAEYTSTDRKARLRRKLYQGASLFSMVAPVVMVLVGPMDASAAQQRVTGADVSGGNGKTPALAMGAIHINSSLTTTYTVSNTGNGTLTGALQPVSPTDQRLTGSGVTAGNYSVTNENPATYSVTLNGTTAGAVNEAVDLTGGNGQVLDITGTVYNYAKATLGSTTLSLGNFRVGTTASQALSLTNSAPNNGYSEGLTASFSGTTGNATATGSIGSSNLIAAGATNNTALQVGISTSTVGAKSGTAILALTSDGTGTSGLGTTALASQTVTVSGTVFREAVGSVAPTTINLGNTHVGSSLSQALTVSNTAATDGFSEGLTASFSGFTGGATGTGTTGVIAAGRSSTALSVGLSTTTAGAKSGTATVAYKSDGTGTSGLAAVADGSQSVNVTGAVYNLAQASVTPTTLDFGAYRLNNTVQTKSIAVSNTAASGNYSESLLVSGSSSNAAYSVTNPTSAIVAGGQNSVGVKLSTATAGDFTGNKVTLALTSTGVGTSGLADTSLGPQTVTVDGKVYAAATGVVNTPSVNFGIVHIGDNVSSAISVKNSTAVQGLNDTLTASFGTVGGPFSGSGSISGLGASQTNSSLMTVGLNTSNAGSFSSSAQINMASHNSDMADLALNSASVALTAQVNAYAKAGFTEQSGGGTLSGSGTAYTLNFGKVLYNSSFSTAALKLSNLLQGSVSANYTDALGGTFTESGTGASGFDLSAFGNTLSQISGGSSTNLDVSFFTNTLGAFTEAITFHGLSINNSTTSALQDITLTLTGFVVTNMPEPVSGALLLPALGGLGWIRRRRRTV